MIKILADECVYRKTVEVLRNRDIDVASVIERGLSGYEDSVLLRLAVSEKRVFLTADLDFGHIRHYPPADHLGVIVLRIRPMTQEQIHHLLVGFLQDKPAEQMVNKLVIISHTKIRIREG